MSLLLDFGRVFTIIDFSMQVDVYTMIRFSGTSLPRADILTDLIVLTLPHEISTDIIPIIIEVTLQATKPNIFVHGKEYF